MPALTPHDVHPTFVDAFNRGDIDALMELYEPDAVFVTSPGTTVAGLADIRAAIEGLRAVQGDLSITTRWVTVAGDVALLHGAWSLSGVDPDGAAHDVAALDTEVVRRGKDGAWRFVIDDPFGNVERP